MSDDAEMAEFRNKLLALGADPGEWLPVFERVAQSGVEPELVLEWLMEWSERGE